MKKNENNKVEVGINRTGAALAPERAEAMVAACDEFYPSSDGDASAIGAVRIAYAREAEPIGSLPPPATIKGVVKTAVKAMTGAKPTLFLDKLGERLAFERTGTRLYEALLVKVENLGSFSNGPTRETVTTILKDEWQHFQLVEAAIVRLSGDPTAVTPSANLAAVETQGVVAVVLDPRTNVLQCLEATLIAELVDNDCWEVLVDLAERAGEEELADSFRDALENERTHLDLVRAWIAAGQGRMDAVAAEEATAEP